ncbi:dihydropteroate synthase [Rubinisphaera margarita]|uniref:dihydropteroate synthase n=1 Tax=Rubinisphaera margarita TaxID=2909586 RepID=UPI001EE8D6DD|nr:dihydropteroate synthase [Rubinisphaera margarita]MCG6157122.1 dihydropteroate synthase [Rubinisphaera margarita]
MTADSTAPLLAWKFGRRDYQLGHEPLIMGIVNVTPDSFSDGGHFQQTDAAVAHALRLVGDGADILDIGGESTRPRAEPVTVDDELARVVPVIERLAGQISIPISIDTTKAEVARQSLAAGAEIVNDISGLTFDADMPGVCSDSGAGVVCMHIQGTPQTMQDNPHYEDCVAEIDDWLQDRLATLRQQGIPSERVVLDPGIGFGKTAQHNLEILSSIAAIRSKGRPVLIGHSRKSFLKKLLHREMEERLAGTLGVSIALAEQHTDILRVHDVASVKDALLAWQTIRDAVK